MQHNPAQPHYRLKVEMLFISTRRNVELPGVMAEVFDRYFRYWGTEETRIKALYPLSSVLPSSFILMSLRPLFLVSAGLVPWRTLCFLQEDTPGGLAARISFCGCSCFEWHSDKGWCLPLCPLWPCKRCHPESWFSWFSKYLLEHWLYLGTNLQSSQSLLLH